MGEIRVPKLGLDTVEGEITQWLVKVGERVERGTPLLEVESEKAVITIESEESGVVSRISARPGDSVPVGSTVGVIDETAV